MPMLAPTIALEAPRRPLTWVCWSTESPEIFGNGNCDARGNSRGCDAV